MDETQNTAVNPDTQAPQAPAKPKKFNPRGTGGPKHRHRAGVSKRKARKVNKEPKLRTTLPLLNAALRVWELKNGYN
jgi:hypothetical protein